MSLSLRPSVCPSSFHFTTYFPSVSYLPSAFLYFFLSICLQLFIFVYLSISLLASVCPSVIICPSILPHIFHQWVNFPSVSIFLFFCPSVCQCFSLSICPSVNSFVFLFIHLSICLSFYTFISPMFSSVCSSVCFSVYFCQSLSTLSSVRFFRPSIFLFVCPSVSGAIFFSKANLASQLLRNQSYLIFTIISYTILKLQNLLFSSRKFFEIPKTKSFVGDRSTDIFELMGPLP